MNNTRRQIQTEVDCEMTIRKVIELFKSFFSQIVISFILDKLPSSQEFFNLLLLL